MALREGGASGEQSQQQLPQSRRFTVTDLKHQAAEYYRNNEVPQRLEEVLNAMFYHRPADFYGYLVGGVPPRGVSGEGGTPWPLALPWGRNKGSRPLRTSHVGTMTGAGKIQPGHARKERRLVVGSGVAVAGRIVRSPHRSGVFQMFLD